jgi:hypothetical protein
VVRLERDFQQRIRLEIDLRRREVVDGSPVSGDALQALGDAIRRRVGGFLHIGAERGHFVVDSLAVRRNALMKLHQVLADPAWPHGEL